ncbi:MAG: HTH-type transcriptional activator Btr [Lentisphaerae bacterium ADurb.Bin242]|nr:MAG: HTH-type transcriptional activator Btr [Lentisphaerae bacterium ADurb.Bin242]
MKILFSQLTNVERTLPFKLPVSYFYYHDKAFHNNKTKHTLIDFGIELSCEDEYSEFFIDGIKYRRKFPWVSTRCPGHVYQMQTKHPWEVIVFSYDAAFLDELKAMGLDPENPGWEFSLTADLRLLIENIFKIQEYISIPGAADRLDSFAVNILRLTRLGNIENEKSAAEIAVQKIASYFLNNLSHKINLDDLVRKNNISKRSFFRYWNKIYGMPPCEFIIAKKIELAQRTLLTTNLKIYEIADYFGFKEHTYFSRLFRLKTGLTPNQYRNQKQTHQKINA